MTSLLKTSLMLSMLIMVVRAENSVFTDPAFPYRIVCKTNWVQESKNDSEFILKNTSPGKKTRFQLQKYSIDTGFDILNQAWARLRFAVNKQLAMNIGRLVFVDTTANKKLGNYHAFELCAIFSDSAGNKNVWWGEYSRWTDYNGFGYIASIISSDTENVKNRDTIATYKALLDSINISQIGTNAIAKIPTATIQWLPASSSTWYDILGRNTHGNSQRPNAIMVKKNLKYLLIQ
jgi:hypothetical protein